MTTVYDLPIWNDCPFRESVPAHIEIRRSTETVEFWDEEHQLGVTLPAMPNLERDVLPALDMLAQAGAWAKSRAV